MAALTIAARDPLSLARAGVLRTAHGDVRTPAFVPLATKATVKGLLPEEVAGLGYEMVLGNTFHLLLRPGEELIERLGGLHRFMDWERPIITDSGGFQVFSMGHGTVADEIKARAPHGGRDGTRDLTGTILEISEDGVRFRSYVDGGERFLSPEGSMAVQAALGSDIALVFDECTPFHVDRDYTERSTERTHRWLERCLRWHVEHGAERAARLRDRAGRRPRGSAPRLGASRRARAAARGSRSAGRWVPRRRRCTRSCASPPRSSAAPTRRCRVTCWGSARSTI